MTNIEEHLQKAHAALDVADTEAELNVDQQIARAQAHALVAIAHVVEGYAR